MGRKVTKRITRGKSAQTSVMPPPERRRPTPPPKPTPESVSTVLHEGSRPHERARGNGLVGLLAALIVVVGMVGTFAIIDLQGSVARDKMEFGQSIARNEADSHATEMKLCNAQRELWKIVADKDTKVAAIDAQAAKIQRASGQSSQVDDLFARGIKAERDSARAVAKKLRNLCR